MAVRASEAPFCGGYTWTEKNVSRVWREDLGRSGGMRAESACWNVLADVRWGADLEADGLDGSELRKIRGLRSCGCASLLAYVILFY